MSKIVESVVDTYSLKERQELINYFSKHTPFIGLTSDYDGFELYAITKNGGGWVGVIVAKTMVEKEGFKHFTSVKDFINYCESN